MPDGVSIPGGPSFAGSPQLDAAPCVPGPSFDGFMSVPGGPGFEGHPQPPDVPCDPVGDAWRGEPGPVGPSGAPGVPGPAGPAGATGPQGPAGTGGDFSTMTGTATFSQLPPEVALVPIAFAFPGKPAAGALVNVPMAMSLVVAASLAGTTAYDTTKATASSVFTINRITGGTTVTSIGTATITSASNTSVTLAGSGATLAIGDVLQVVAPSVQDATLADVSLTILANRI